MNLVDMHIHSCYSDGTRSPQEILEEAERKGIKILAITDHDVLEGSRELLELARSRKGTHLQVLAGVELTSVQNGHTYHILGYGVDLEQKEFQNFVRENRTHLDGMNDVLIRRMEPDYPQISWEDYNAYVFVRGMGGWKTLHYLKARGLAESLTDALKYYGMYQVCYEEAGFTDVNGAIRAVHRAGGRAVLAHPGKVIRTEDTAALKEKLTELLELGLDGVECWYPSHSEELRDSCLQICRERGLLITCGSDSHGQFEVEDTPMGILPVTEEQVVLNGLLEAWKAK